MGELETKEDLEAIEDQPPSPYTLLRQISGEAVRVAGEAITNAYNGSANMPPAGLHRRSRSEVVQAGHRRANSFQRWKSTMQKAWRWGDSAEEQQRRHSNFNPEVLANQKRQWYQIHSNSIGRTKYKEPNCLFEHFVIVGLNSDSNLAVVEDAFAKRKTWELEMSRSELYDCRMLQYRGPSAPTLEPQILFKYPPGKKLTMKPKDLPAFCFPGGVKARLLERTPSLSDLNEVVYGQGHLGRDDFSFIFSLKVADNATLYGVCLHVQEIVQRPPGILGVASPLSQSSGECSRFLVSAPRCYCLLTRVPFFELHYEMLNSIISQERLNRVTQFVSDMTLTDHIPSVIKVQDQMNENEDFPNREWSVEWTTCAIPLDSAVALTAAAAGIISDDDVPSFSFRSGESQSPESVSTSDASSQAKRSLQILDDYLSETSETRSDCFEKLTGNYGTGQTSPEVGTILYSKSLPLARLESSESLLRCSVRSLGSEDEDDEVCSVYDTNAGCDVMMKWAKEHQNDLLQIVCGYHALPLPPQGSEIIFQPLEHLQAIKYSRPAVSTHYLCENDPCQGTEVNVRLAAAEEALALSIWTISTVCRVLSLETVLALFTGVLLEKQVVVVCPNLGVLSAIVLSLVPMIRPFEWQSLFLPVLPRKMFDFLDAPVPFIVGIQQKPAEMKLKRSNLVSVNVYKDQVCEVLVSLYVDSYGKVKMCNMPPLPRHKELSAKLGPLHGRLSCEDSIAKRQPVYKCNEVQARAAEQFLNVMRDYLDSLCSDLRTYTITSVQSNNDRVSLLLKDSYIDSFPGRDRPFIKQFVDTQLFSVLSDSRLSRYEHE
ncbi:hypothetical protein GIB67_024624 [Kingdonia uniflora]|uniref:UDENN domain-containing protein n=1 Tax=Kingdonia uniflora TaxID=39325 RepID=A0A7J7LP42_9MAGN|nr:hypothetical protein GIB67_024624 [Kingdonia uniflora]